MPERNHSAPDGEPSTASRVSFGEFVFDPTTGELVDGGGTTVQLEPQPAKVLRLLIDRAGSVVSRSELRRHVWADGRHVEADQGLNYCIRELRRALGDSAQDPRYIETLRRRGYRFIRKVEPAGADRPPGDAEAPDRAPPATAGDALEDPVPRRSPWWLLAALTVAVSLAALWAVQAPQAGTSYGAPSTGSRVGVLAFDAPGGVEADEDLAAAIAAALVSELTRIGDRTIEVIPATSSFAYRGSGKTVGEIGRTLRADYLVEGSVRSGEAGRVVDVRLVDTAEESIVWSETYVAGGPRPDELAEAVARDVARALDLDPETIAEGVDQPGRSASAGSTRAARPNP